MGRHIRNGIVLIVLCSLLVACGGGGGGGGESSINTPSTPQETIGSISKAALLNDNTSLYNNFTEEAIKRYSSVLNVTSNMKEFGESISKAKQVKLSENYAIYESTYNDGGKEYWYYINFVKDNNGKWKMDVF